MRFAVHADQARLRADELAQGFLPSAAWISSCSKSEIELQLPLDALQTHRVF